MNGEMSRIRTPFGTEDLWSKPTKSARRIAYSVKTG
jgi:hypothetical protein